MKWRDILIVAMVAVIFFLIGYFVSNRKFENIEKYEKENKVLQRESDSLKMVVQLHQIEIEYRFDVIDSLNDAIAIIDKKLTENRGKYEKEAIDINNMSDDSLFLLFREYVSK